MLCVKAGCYGFKVNVKLASLINNSQTNSIRNIAYFKYRYDHTTMRTFMIGVATTANFKSCCHGNVKPVSKIRTQYAQLFAAKFTLIFGH